LVLYACHELKEDFHMLRILHIKALAAACAMLLPLLAHADLRTYVHAPDDSYQWSIEAETDLGVATGYSVRLVSQTWRGIEWTHWLSVIVPKELKHTDKAMLMVGGGNNRSSGPRQNSQETQALTMIASQTGAICAVIEQVPNQPLYDDMYEDDLIAHTYEQFLETGESDWPLLLPMVKSAVRAMDAVTEMTAEKANANISQFMVTGASKRGWTTWLAAAADPRIKAIAPMVIDTLNMPAQTEHQLLSYGEYSEQIQDYTERGLQDRMESVEGAKLLAIVDPYSYIDDISIPKLVVLGSNDPYWSVDSSSLYFPELVGDKWLFYDPNAGHGLSLNVVQPILAFYQSFLTGAPLPTLDWTKNGDGSISVSWEGSSGSPVLWEATSDTRDFRESRFESTLLEANGNSVTVIPEKPESGWKAYFVEVRFPSNPPLTSKSFSTEMTVIPDVYPNFGKVAGGDGDSPGEAG